MLTYLIKRSSFYGKQNYRGITLTPIAAEIYNLIQLNRIRPDIDPIQRKNQSGFRTKRSTTRQMLTIRRILEWVTSKSLPATILFIYFIEAFDSINREKMKDILPTEIVNAILILKRILVLW